MSRIRRITSLLLFLALSACTPAGTPVPLSTESSLFIFSLPRSALMEYSTDKTLLREIPVQLPCPLTGTHPAPNQPLIALELECTNGPLVQIVETTSGRAWNPVTGMDSHFLAWDFDGNIHLRVDALGNTRVVRVGLDGRTENLDLPVQTYDMDFAPDGKRLVYSLTRGIGLGSETWSTDANGQRKKRILAEPDAIITFARWSPDGSRIAFIKMSDSQTPFPPGELWVMEADGGNPHRLAAADAGHGFAAAWSPDSKVIAFVGRDNPDDPAADLSAGALISSIQLVNSEMGKIDRIPHINEVLVEAPQWSADGHFLAFSVVSLNDTITPWIANLVTGEVVPLESSGAACCPAWIRK
jgi:WD40 repeat protein